MSGLDLRTSWFEVMAKADIEIGMEDAMTQDGTADDGQRQT